METGEEKMRREIREAMQDANWRTRNREQEDEIDISSLEIKGNVAWIYVGSQLEFNKVRKKIEETTDFIFFSFKQAFCPPGLVKAIFVKEAQPQQKD